MTFFQFQMAPTEKKEKAVKGEGTKRTHKQGKPRNYDLGNGVLRFSRTKMFHKKALYKFIGKKVAATKKPSKPLVIEKPIGGEKNGGKRFVLVKKRRASYPTQDRLITSLQGTIIFFNGIFFVELKPDLLERISANIKDH